MLKTESNIQRSKVNQWHRMFQPQGPLPTVYICSTGHFTHMEQKLSRQKVCAVVSFLLHFHSAVSNRYSAHMYQ